MSNPTPKQRARKITAQQKRALRSAPRFRVLPLTLIMLGLLLVNKVNDLYFNSMQLRAALNVSSAVAMDAPEEEKAEEGAHGGDDGKGGGKDAEPEVTMGTGKTTIKEIMALKEKQNVEGLSAVERELLQSLAKRREELDQREREFGLKEKILDATEDRINKRINEMKSLQAELQGVLDQYKQQQDSEIRSLVKIYENMKPVQAAIIFNELDMDIMLSVVDKMSERKVAPVLASMDPRKAKEVTERLAELRQLRSHIAKKAINLTDE